MSTKTTHRLTWRMFCPVTVQAETREQAIEKAIYRRPNHLPPGAELYYGMVAGTPVYTVPDWGATIHTETLSDGSVVYNVFKNGQPVAHPATLAEAVALCDELNNPKA